MDDAFNLERFIAAQEPVLSQILSELSDGRKRTHWMWFIFPQLAGLSSSARGIYYAIASLGEARAYLRHPILGQRLVECTRLVNAVQGRSARAILGPIDEMKFQSCMTLFGAAQGEAVPFQEALDKYFEGRRDQATLDRLA